MTITVEQHRIQSERGKAAIAALETTNAIAARDSTTNVSATNRLGEERRASYAMTATIDSVQRTMSAAVVTPAIAPETGMRIFCCVRRPTRSQPPWTCRRRRSLLSSR
jgi:hypothetical protein